MEKLGIEPVLLLAQVVNFFIIMVLLKKYLRTPLNTMALLPTTYLLWAMI